MLESKSVAEGEVSLQHYVEVIRRRRWTILYTAVAIFVLGCVATALMRPIYEAQSKLLVRATEPQITQMDGANPLGDLLAMAQPESAQTQIEILQSEPFINAVLDASHVPRDRWEPEIRVRNIPDTNVLQVTVQYPDAKAAARVANTMLDHYLDHTRSISMQEITHAREFVERQVGKARRALQKSEDAQLRFRRTHGVAQLTAEQQSRTQEFVSLGAKSDETQNQIHRLRAQIQKVQGQLARQPPERVLNLGQRNPGLDTLQSRLAEAKVEQATLSRSYKPGSPEMRQVEARIASLQAQLRSEPAEQRVPLHVANDRFEKLSDRLDTHQAEVRGLEAEYAQLQVQLREKRARMNQLGPWEVRMAQLQRDRDMAEKSYLTLAERLEDLRIRENARRSNARILERAWPPRTPVRPRKVANLTLALLLGLFLGGCLAFLLESLDDRLMTTEEVDRLLALPVFGFIPAMTGERRLLHSLPPHSAVAESYRGLRSSIGFSSVDAPLTTLGVTSARPGEGKSTTAVNLALAMAMDGRSVILVDSDLRRPSIHRVLGWRSSSPGLTDVLTGHCSLDDALRAVPDRELLVLRSGPIPPNPAELLNTGGMESLIHQLRDLADIVIFDAPPCLAVTDAQVLGSKLDGMLLVAQMGEARKGEVRRVRELLDQARIRVLGVVFNKADDQSTGYYRYSYSSKPYTGEYLSNGHHNGQEPGPGPVPVSIHRARRTDGQGE